MAARSLPPTHRSGRAQQNNFAIMHLSEVLGCFVLVWFFFFLLWLMEFLKME